MSASCSSPAVNLCHSDCLDDDAPGNNFKSISFKKIITKKFNLRASRCHCSGCARSAFAAMHATATLASADAPSPCRDVCACGDVLCDVSSVV